MSSRAPMPSPCYVGVTEGVPTHTPHGDDGIIPTHSKLFREHTHIDAVMDEVLGNGQKGNLNILSAASSFGPEAVTILSYAENNFGVGPINLQVSDVNPILLQIAEAGQFLLRSTFSPRMRLNEAGQQDMSAYAAELKAYGLDVSEPDENAHIALNALPLYNRHEVNFIRADLLNADEVAERLKPADLILCNNFTFNVDNRTAIRALAHLSGRLREGGVISLGGYTDDHLDTLVENTGFRFDPLPLQNAYGHAFAFQKIGR